MERELDIQTFLSNQIDEECFATQLRIASFCLNHDRHLSYIVVWFAIPDKKIGPPTCDGRPFSPFA